jgi:large subunit ribosomal protein L15
MSAINIKKPRGSTKAKKCLGRGNGSGHGATSCRGGKGQTARAGGNVRRGFEGGQMPLYRRLARRGFSNHPFKIEYEVINMSDIERVFKDGDKISKKDLFAKGLVKGRHTLVKLLGDGVLSKKVSIEVDKASAKATEIVIGKGGEVIVLRKVDETPVKSHKRRNKKKPIAAPKKTEAPSEKKADKSEAKTKEPKEPKEAKPKKEKKAVDKADENGK